MPNHPDPVQTAAQVELDNLVRQAQRLSRLLNSPTPPAALAGLLVDLGRLRTRLDRHEVRLAKPSSNGEGGAA